jgi:hypothetical protein
MRKLPYFTREEYQLTKVALAREEVPAEAFARRPYRRKAGHYPRWNGFYLLLYRDVEEDWKLVQIRKDSSYAQFVPVYAARIKAVEEIKKRLGNGLGDDQE